MSKLPTMNKIVRALNKFNREQAWKDKKKKVLSQDITILSNTCIAGIVYHDLGRQFISPTINLSIPVDQFIKFCASISRYRSAEMKDITQEAGRGYPVGLLEDVEVNFVHYKTFAEAKHIFFERFSRINLKKIAIIAVAPPKDAEKIVEEFEKLPYKNKVILVGEDMPQYPDAYHLQSLNGKNDISSYCRGLGGKRYFDDFDVISF
jgi:uncharacterized protein (DUF1919 family)